MRATSYAASIVAYRYKATSGTQLICATSCHTSYAQPHTGAIKAIYSAIDFSKDGINEVVIGRDTGSLEVYGFDQHHQPALLFQSSLEESISSIDGGFFTSPNVQVRHDCTAANLLYIVQCALSASERYVTG